MTSCLVWCALPKDSCLFYNPDIQTYVISNRITFFLKMSCLNKYVASVFTMYLLSSFRCDNYQALCIETL